MPTTIPQILTWPDQTIVDAVQLQISGVYEYRSQNGANGPYTVQNADATDVAGNKIRLSVWNHPDISTLKGKEVMLHSVAQRGGKLGGVKVKHGSYKNKTTNATVATVELEVSKSGIFQFVEVYKAHNKDANTANPEPVPANLPDKKAGDHQPATSAPTGQITRIHGATVGMAINLVCANLTARGESLDPKVIYAMASPIVKVALHMEAGNLAKETDPVENVPVEEKKGDEPEPF